MNNVVVKIEMSGNRYNAYDVDGNKLTSKIGTGTRKNAFEAGQTANLHGRQIKMADAQGKIDPF